MSESGNNSNPNLRLGATTGQRHGLRGFIGTKTGKAAVAGAALLTAAAVFGVVKANEGHSSPTQQIAAATVPANTSRPVETIIPKDSEIVASPISAEKYTTPEAVVRAATTEANQWIIDGGTEANAIACLNAKVSGDFTDNLMVKSDAEFRNQLVVGNWQDIPSLKLYVIHTQEIHRSTTVLAFFTMPNNPYSGYNDQNKEAYKRSEVIDSVQIISQKSTQIFARVFAHEYDNSDMNAVLQYTKVVVISTAPYDYGLTMDKVGKNWKISGYAE